MEWAIWFHVWGFLFKKRSSIQTQSCTDYIISILLKNVCKDSSCKSPTLLCMTYIDQRPSASYSCGRRYHTETCKGRFKCEGECASSGCWWTPLQLIEERSKQSQPPVYRFLTSPPVFVLWSPWNFKHSWLSICIAAKRWSKQNEKRWKGKTVTAA